MDIVLEMADGSTMTEKLGFGEILNVPLAEGEVATAILSPRDEFDVGAGRGKKREVKVDGGAVGLMIDARGRPMTLPDNGKKRIKLLLKWFNALDLYPKLSALSDGDLEVE